MSIKGTASRSNHMCFWPFHGVKNTTCFNYPLVVSDEDMYPFAIVNTVGLCACWRDFVCCIMIRVEKCHRWRQVPITLNEVRCFHVYSYWPTANVYMHVVLQNSNSYHCKNSQIFVLIRWHCSNQPVFVVLSLFMSYMILIIGKKSFIHSLSYCRWCIYSSYWKSKEMRMVLFHFLY